MFNRAVKFGRVDVFGLQNFPGKVDDHQLHAQTQAEIGDVVRAGIVERAWILPSMPRLPKPPGDEDAGGFFEYVPAAAFFQVGGMNPTTGPVSTPRVQGGMFEGFTHAHVGVVQFDRIFPPGRF